jgi:hypothetical protein
MNPPFFILAFLAFVCCEMQLYGQDQAPHKNTTTSSVGDSAFLEQRVYAGIQPNTTICIHDSTTTQTEPTRTLQTNSTDTSGGTSPSPVLAEDSLYVPLSQFRYANQALYTPDGSPPRRFTEIRPIPAIVTGAAVAGMVAGLQIYQTSVFWNDRVSFRIIDEGDIEVWADKGGHFMAGYIASRLSKDALLTAGFSWEMATIGGSLMGLGYQTYVEIMDGYGRQWGFSPTDALMNTLGASFHTAQYFVPFLQNFSPKLEFYPSPWIGEKTRKGSVNPLDDYSAWTWWLSVNVHNLLPESLKSYYPSWLNIAVGYAGRNIDWSDMDRRIIISLDYNLEKILPEGGAFWNWIRQYVNLIKLPAPAVEFTLSPSGGYVRPPRFYLLFPFKIGATP